MNDTAAWTDLIPAGGADQKPFAARPAIILSALMLALGLSFSAWTYYQETRSLSDLLAQQERAKTAKGPEIASLLLRQFDRWAFWTVAGTAMGSTGFLLVMVAGLGYWQRASRRQNDARELEWRKAAASVHSQLTDSRKCEEQAQEALTAARKQAANLVYANGQIEAELNQVRRAEKNLSQQRQSLESSKTVLELHVEARTKELQKLKGRYEHILNSAGEGICGLDAEGRTTFANPAVAKITGWPLEELVGMTEQEIFWGNGASGAAAVEGENLGEQVFHRQDGTAFPVEFVKTPINENGRVVGAVLVFKDITERKRVDGTLAQKAAELARSNSELEQFAFVASHDLQEPLRKIQAFGDRLKTKCQGAIAAEAHDYLERMQGAAARMRTLIDDLLAFSRVIRSSEPFVPVDLNTITKEVMGDLEVRIEKTNGRVDFSNLPTIEADPMQMRQLMLNLLSNALKFQPANSQPAIKIQSRVLNPLAGEPMCELTVEDNGIGFEEKYMDKVFAVFQRLHGRNEYEGTGVGLAVCRRIADRHHGTITARSELGKGSTFIVTLPLRRPKPEAPE